MLAGMKRLLGPDYERCGFLTVAKGSILSFSSSFLLHFPNGLNRFKER
jgi:hypothetical protein